MTLISSYFSIFLSNAIHDNVSDVSLFKTWIVLVLERPVHARMDATMTPPVRTACVKVTNSAG